MELQFTMWGVLEAVEGILKRLEKEILVLNTEDVEKADENFICGLYLNRDLISLNLKYCKEHIEFVLKNLETLNQSDEKVYQSKAQLMICIDHITAVQQENNIKKSYIESKMKHVRKH